jgi:glycosidase
MTQLGGDAARARVAASAMLMLPGMPFVYYGEEIGMLGDKPDETIRNPMQWSQAPNGGFTNGTPWESLQPDWMTKNVTAQNRDSASVLNHYRRLIRLRNAHPALNSGNLSVVATDDTTGAIAAWKRSTDDEAFYIVVNFGEHHGPLYSNKLAPKLRGGGPYRLELQYFDPPRACSGIFMSAEDNAVQINSIAPRSACILQIRRYDWHFYGSG